MKVTEARKITDSLTRTSKMPGLSYSLPAWACQTGAKLRKVKTSPCYGCYAMKNNYTRYPAIKEAQYRRLDAINHPQWVEAMAAQIKRQKWFRWHDAGDLQSKEQPAGQRAQGSTCRAGCRSPCLPGSAGSRSRAHPAPAPRPGSGRRSPGGPYRPRGPGVRAARGLRRS